MNNLKVKQSKYKLSHGTGKINGPWPMQLLFRLIEADFIPCLQMPQFLFEVTDRPGSDGVTGMFTSNMLVHVPVVIVCTIRAERTIEQWPTEMLFHQMLELILAWHHNLTFAAHFVTRICPRVDRFDLLLSG